jgi:dTDP-L-rhamnose 4-epimerase
VKRGPVPALQAERGYITAARKALGYEPQVGFADGMAELCAWIAEEAPAAEDRVAASTSELVDRGLVI